MLVIVRNNDNTETTYSFEPNSGRDMELRKFYVNEYMNLRIQGFQIQDSTGKVLHFAGSN